MQSPAPSSLEQIRQGLDAALAIIHGRGWRGYAAEKEKVDAALSAVQALGQQASAVASPDDGGGCTLAGPGRGDCEHFVGLPGRSIPGQHDGPDDTVDCYGKPNGWCWSCWKSRRIAELEARLASPPALQQPEAGSGWQWVPKEPTEAMTEAACREFFSRTVRGFYPPAVAMQVAWDAMLLACAPSPTEPADGGKHG